MHIHILGICGTFMGGVAAIAREAGHRVTGCDSNVYPPMSEQLQALGIDLVEGWSTAQLDIKPDLWVVGNVVARGNPLLEALLERGARLVSGPQWLAEHALAGRWVLAVAGTHGKTTAASMLAWVLERAGLAPGFLIGGVPFGFDVSARLGTGEHFVIEADEYDTAFFDKRSKFVHYWPRTAILNNLEFDHADIFSDLAAIETQFHHLVRTVPGNGLVIRPAASDALDRVLARGLWSACETIGPGGQWQVSRVREQPEASEFDVLFEGQDLGRTRLVAAGEHNRANALAVLAAARHAGVAPRDAMTALAAFPGVRRRLEMRGEVNGVVVIDDFAHHPTEIATTIAGLRARLDTPPQGAGAGRVLAVFEPRSNTMKLGVMRAALAGSLEQADLVFCHAGGLEWSAAEALAPLGSRASVHTDLDALIAAVVAAARAGDRILVMSNGGFQGIHERLLAALAQGPDAPARPLAGSTPDASTR